MSRFDMATWVASFWSEMRKHNGLDQREFIEYTQEMDDEDILVVLENTQHYNGRIYINKDSEYHQDNLS